MVILSILAAWLRERESITSRMRAGRRNRPLVDTGCTTSATAPAVPTLVTFPFTPKDGSLVALRMPLLFPFAHATHETLSRFRHTMAQTREGLAMQSVQVGVGIRGRRQG